MRTRANRSNLLLSTLMAVLGIGLCTAEAAMDGFSVMPLFPLTQGLAPYANSAGSILKPGQVSLSSAFVWTNTLRYDDGSIFPGYYLVVDSESAVERLDLRFGIGLGFELEAWLEGSQLYAGSFDTLIESFHLAFGFPNQARASFPSNQLEVLVDTPRGRALYVDTPQTGFTSWGLGVSVNPQLGLPLTLGIKLKLPVLAARAWLLSQVPSLSTSFTWHREWSFVETALSLGVAWQADAGFGLYMPIRTTLIQGGARLFFRLGPSILLGIEAAGSQSPYFTDEMYLGGMVGNLWIGGRIRLSEEWSLDVALIEELASWASIEVGCSLGLTWKPRQAR